MKKQFYSYLTPLLIIVLLVGIFSPLRYESRKVLLNFSNGICRRLEKSGSKTKNLFSFITNISKLKKQNETLSSKIISLEVDRSKILELENENKLLKQELGFSAQNKEFALIPATIIGREPTSFLDHVIVDKGEEDGVAKNMGVISGGVLIGQVSEVYSGQSRITLITSKDSLILSMLQDSRSKGLLHGGISGLVLEDIIQDADFTQGEYVVTSGLDGNLKPGILIGKTSGIESSSSDLFKNISVEPIVDLSLLELVFIVK